MRILHLTHTEIDHSQWDEVISLSRNKTVYALSWFLDCVSPRWEALVSDDFQYVMPLPAKKKFGIKYLVQPILTQQLGVFSPHPLSEEVVKQFIGAIPYCSYELFLNEKNIAENLTKLPNLLLSLNVSYEHLVKKFSVNTRRNIRKAENYRLKMEWNVSLEEFLRFFFQEEKNYTLPDRQITKALVEKGMEREAMVLSGVKTPDGKLIAVLGWTHFADRLIYLLPSSNKSGKEQSAMFFLINEIIKKYAATEQILDFEGSKIEGVARFYKGFGAKPISYYKVKRFRPTFLIGKL